MFAPDLLEKGIAYHNADLTWEERNLIETYLKKGEIKLICATTTLAMGINLPFKNVILSLDKYNSDDGDYRNSYLTSLTMTEMAELVGDRGEEGKKIYQDILELKEENPNLDTEDYLSIKKTLNR